MSLDVRHERCPHECPHGTGWASVRVCRHRSDRGLSGGGDRDRTGYLLHAMQFQRCPCYIVIADFVGGSLALSGT
jgi:hypothetical protein